MPIEEWKEPIYLLQKGENKRAHYYFKRKKDEKLTLRQLEQKLTKEYHTLINKAYTNPKQFCNEFKKHFADYDVKKFTKCYDFEKQQPKEYVEDYVPVSCSQLGQWSASDNWEDRIFQETKDIEESNAKLKLKIKADTDIEIFKLQEEARLLNLKDLVLGLKTKSVNGTQRQAMTKSNKDLQDARNRDLGEVKDINQSNIQADVNANTENTHGIDNQLLEDLYDVYTRRNQSANHD